VSRESGAGDSGWGGGVGGRKWGAVVKEVGAVRAEYLGGKGGG